MATHFFGRWGQYFTWALYIFLFYSLTVAYAAGGGGIISLFFKKKIAHGLGVCLFSGLLGLVVFVGTKAVDRFNRICMGGLFVTFFLFIIFGVANIDHRLLTKLNWKSAYLPLPVIFTSFGYQGIIPSIAVYLRKNAYKVRVAVFIGTTIPFVLYLLWEYLIMGIVPTDGPEGLIAAGLKGETAVYPLRNILKNKYIYLVGQFFSLLALVTSFLGVTLALIDFLSDGFNRCTFGRNKLCIWSLAFIPPTLIAILFPSIFLLALGFAGGIGCALLLGLLPILMVWKGRSTGQITKKMYQLQGGKTLLLLLAVCIMLVVSIEFMGVVR